MKQLVTPAGKPSITMYIEVAIPPARRTRTYISHPKRAELRKRAKELRGFGMTYAEIAQELNVSQTGAWNLTH